MALEGIRILEWTAFLNGPVGGYMLGDLGAEVIKIEQPVRGDPTRGMQSLFGASMIMGDLNVAFDMYNRNKKSVTLDLAKDEGKQVFYRLVERSDVFLTNYRKSLAAKLGLGYNTLRQYNPKLIYATCSGYGHTGSDVDQRVFDPIIQARSGIMTVMGERDAPPGQIVGAILDQLGGTLLAYGIMVALLARERQGIGQEVDTSMLGGAVHLQFANVNTCLLRNREMARHSRTRARNPLANHYQCADGKWLMLAEPQSDRFWHNFCEIMGIEELENDPKFENALRRRETFAELIPILEKKFATKTRDDWMRLFKEKAQFAYASVNTIPDLTADPQVLENEYIIPLNHPRLGPIRIVGSPIRFSETPIAMRSLGPELGQHTEEVLLEIGGYSWEEITELKEQEVI